MALFHVFNTVDNRKTGVPMAGVNVRAKFDGTDTIAPIYADQDGTAFEPANVCTTDDDGMYSFYIDAGEYTLEFLVGGVLIKSIPDFRPAEVGPSGPANSTFQTTEDLEMADPSNISAILAETGKAGTFTIREYADFATEIAADTGKVNYIRSTLNPDQVWVRTSILPEAGEQLGMGTSPAEILPDGGTAKEWLDLLGDILGSRSPWTYASRAEAEAANVPSVVKTIGVLSGNRVLNYVRDASGTALETGDGATWSPADDVTPLHFGAVGDGVTTDQAAVSASVAFAFATGAELCWPEGTYLTTANIANFHNVRHRGPGIVKRGANLFAVQPKYTSANSFFASPSGTTANDGLSSSEPTLPQTAASRLTNYGPTLNGSWEIVLADGTYDVSVNGYNTCIIPEGLTSIKRITIRAATDAGGFRVTPAVTFDRGSASAYRSGIGGSGKIDVYVKDIKCVGFKNGATPDVEGFDSGFRFGGDATIEYYNCHADDCDIGFYNFNEVSYIARGCVATDVGAGFQELFHVTRNISQTAGEHSEVHGYSLSNTYGLRAKELCTGHGNGLRVYDAWCGVNLSRSCTVNMSGASVLRCTYGVMPRNSSSAYIGNVSFGLGTVDETPTPFIIDSTSSMVVEEEELHSNRFTGRGERMMASYTPDPAYGLTGSTTETVVATMSKVRKGALAHPGARLHGEIWGRKSGTAGTLTIFMRYGASNALNVIIPATATIFKVELNLFTKVKGKQTAFVVATTDVGNSFGRGDRTFNFDSVDGEMSIRAQLANAADGVTIDGAWLWSTDGLIEEAFI